MYRYEKREISADMTGIGIVIITLYAILAISCTSLPEVVYAQEISDHKNLFQMEISTLESDQVPLLSGGFDLDDKHPGVTHPRVLELIGAAEKFPGVVDCLRLEDGSGVANLALIAVRKIDSLPEFAICVQHIANALGSPEEVQLWLRHIGFVRVSLNDASKARLTFWGQSADESGTLLSATWRDNADTVAKGYPLSPIFNGTTALASWNLVLMIVFTRDGSVVEVRSHLISI